MTPKAPWRLLVLLLPYMPRMSSLREGSKSKERPRTPLETQSLLPKAAFCLVSIVLSEFSSKRLLPYPSQSPGSLTFPSKRSKRYTLAVFIYCQLCRHSMQELWGMDGIASWVPDRASMENPWQNCSIVPVALMEPWEWGGVIPRPQKFKSTRMQY